MEFLDQEKIEKYQPIKLLLAILAILILVFVFKELFSYRTGERADSAVNYSGQVSRQAVLGEKDMALINEEEAASVSSSENFQITQVNLGGANAEIFDFADDGLFRVSNIKSELYFSKEGEADEIRAVISCRTSRQSYAEIEYFKSGETDKKNIKNNSLSRIHVITLPDLSADSVYKYIVRAEDASGNKTTSEQFVLYTGAANVSLVDILEEAAEKVFGWAF